MSKEDKNTGYRFTIRTKTIKDGYPMRLRVSVSEKSGFVLIEKYILGPEMFAPDMDKLRKFWDRWLYYGLLTLKIDELHKISDIIRDIGGREMVIHKEETTGNPLVDDLWNALRENRPHEVIYFKAGGIIYWASDYIIDGLVVYEDVQITHNTEDRSVTVTIKGHLYQVIYNVEFIQYKESW